MAGKLKDAEEEEERGTSASVLFNIKKGGEKMNKMK